MCEWRGRAAEDEAIGAGDASAVVGERLGQKFFRGGQRLLDDPRVVHHEERLRGHGAVAALADDEARVREVERLEEYRQRVAQHGRIHAAAGIGVLVAVVGAGARLEEWATAREVELAADVQDGVADGFGVETARVLTPEQFVVGVNEVWSLKFGVWGL